VAELQQHVERLGLGRVAQLLDLDPRDLPPLLAGRCGLSAGRLRRLRAVTSGR
jgi:hypothetical protein